MNASNYLIPPPPTGKQPTYYTTCDEKLPRNTVKSMIKMQNNKGLTTQDDVLEVDVSQHYKQIDLVPELDDNNELLATNHIFCAEDSPSAPTVSSTMYNTSILHIQSVPRDHSCLFTSISAYTHIFQNYISIYLLRKRKIAKE